MSASYHWVSVCVVFERVAVSSLWRSCSVLVEVKQRGRKGLNVSGKEPLKGGLESLCHYLFSGIKAGNQMPTNITAAIRDSIIFGSPILQLTAE